MKILATAFAIMMVSALSANAAAPIKETKTQEKAKAPVVALQKSVKPASMSTHKKLHKRTQSITPAKAK